MWPAPLADLVARKPLAALPCQGGKRKVPPSRRRFVFAGRSPSRRKEIEEVSAALGKGKWRVRVFVSEAAGLAADGGRWATLHGPSKPSACVRGREEPGWCQPKAAGERSDAQDEDGFRLNTDPARGREGRMLRAWGARKADGRVPRGYPGSTFDAGAPTGVAAPRAFSEADLLHRGGRFAQASLGRLSGRPRV